MDTLFAQARDLETMAGRFEKAEDAVRYIRAGAATVTLRSQKTGDRFTYKIEKSEDGKVHFVNVLVGSDNESSYKYMGILKRDGFAHGKKARVEETAGSVIAFTWAWKKLATENRLPSQLEVWHEGACGRCGRKLTVPESISSGFGPECIKKVGG